MFNVWGDFCNGRNEDSFGVNLLKFWIIVNRIIVLKIGWFIKWVFNYFQFIVSFIVSR